LALLLPEKKVEYNKKSKGMPVGFEREGRTRKEGLQEENPSLV